MAKQMRMIKKVILKHEVYF